MFLLSDWKDRAGGSDTRLVGYLLIAPPKSQRLKVLDPKDIV